MRRLVYLVFIVMVCSPLWVSASTGYFEGRSIAPTLLTPPFAKGSPEQQKEIEYIITLQKNPSVDALKQAGLERHLSPDTFIASVLPRMERKNFPAVYALLDKVEETSQGVTNTAKEYWKRKRPYLVDKRIKPLVEAHSNYAYPSGHTSGSYVWASVMSMLLPSHSKEFNKRVQDIAAHRVLVGMHFLQDLEGGKQLALLTVGGLLQKQAFLDDLEKARQELKKNGL